MTKVPAEFDQSPLIVMSWLFVFRVPFVIVMVATVSGPWRNHDPDPVIDTLLKALLLGVIF